MVVGRGYIRPSGHCLPIIARPLECLYPLPRSALTFEKQLRACRKNINLTFYQFGRANIQGVGQFVDSAQFCVVRLFRY